MKLLTFVLTLFSLASARGAESPWLYREAPLSDRASISYAIQLPAGFDAQKEYPVLVAFPPGEQDRAAVDKGMTAYWSAGALKNGWIVVSPVSPRGSGAIGGTALQMPELLDTLAKEFKFEGGLVHVAGASGGGRNAIKFASEHPKRCASLTTLPGRVDDEQAVMRLNKLRSMPVRMFVGSEDESWKGVSERIVKRLTGIEGDAKLYVLEGQGHELGEPLTSETLFELLEAMRPGRTLDEAAFAKQLVPVPPENAVIGAVLDDFHDAAAKAEFNRYFSHFAPAAIFYGTDNTERWSVDEFKAYAKPLFDQGKGWAYRMTDRHIFLSEDRKTAWFDERLYAEHMGVCRGSGVLTLRDGAWKIEQYNLTIPVPNDLAKSFVEKIREHGK